MTAQATQNRKHHCVPLFRFLTSHHSRSYLSLEDRHEGRNEGRHEGNSWIYWTQNSTLFGLLASKVRAQPHSSRRGQPCAPSHARPRIRDPGPRIYKTQPGGTTRNSASPQWNKPDCEISHILLSKMGFLTFDQTKTWMVAAHLQQRPLLIAVNALAGMSIFFFGTSR